MKLTQEVIDQIQEAMNHTKKNGDLNWNDGDEIEVQLAGLDRKQVSRLMDDFKTKKTEFVRNEEYPVL